MKDLENAKYKRTDTRDENTKNEKSQRENDLGKFYKHNKGF